MKKNFIILMCLFSFVLISVSADTVPVVQNQKKIGVKKSAVVKKKISTNTKFSLKKVDVKKIQVLLNNLINSKKISVKETLKVDGKLGKKTKLAIKEVQKLCKLKELGRLDKKTLEAIESFSVK